jgi:hypothetical protein
VFVIGDGPEKGLPEFFFPNPFANYQLKIKVPYFAAKIVVMPMLAISGKNDQVDVMRDGPAQIGNFQFFIGQDILQP